MWQKIQMKNLHIGRSILSEDHGYEQRLSQSSVCRRYGWFCGFQLGLASWFWGIQEIGRLRLPAKGEKYVHLKTNINRLVTISVIAVCSLENKKYEDGSQTKVDCNDW